MRADTGGGAFRRRAGVWCFGVLLGLLLPTAFSGDSIIQHVQNGTDVGVGFDHLETGPHDLTMTLQATGAGNELFESWAWDPSGSVIWTSGDSSIQQLEHHWQAFGVMGDDVVTPHFEGHTTEGGGDPYSTYFRVCVSHVDIDLDPGLGGTPDDNTESTTGVNMPITFNGAALPQTFPMEDDTGRFLTVNVTSELGGTLVFQGGGANLAVYQMNGAEWQQVTGGIPVPPGGLFDTFLVHTSNQFTGFVALTARLQHGTTALDAADQVKVVYDGTPPPPDPLLDVDVDSDNDNQATQYRPPSRTQAEDDVEENPGMTMGPAEGWAKVEIHGTITQSGYLTITADNTYSFEFADSGFGILPQGMSLYDGPVDETTPFPMVFYVRPKPGSMNGDTVHITANYNADPPYTSFANDTVTVVLQGSFLPTLDMDVDSDNDNLATQFRPPSRTQTEDDVEEFPGMTMTGGEDWAKIEIHGTFAWPGWLTITADNSSGFEYADAAFNVIPGTNLYNAPVDGTTTFPLVFYVRPTASPMEGEATNITANFYEDGSGNTAMDMVRVLYAAPPPPPAELDVDVDSDNDNQGTQYRPPSRTQAEDDVEENPGMIMGPAEGWAKVEIDGTIGESGYLTITADNQTSFEFADAGFSPLPQGMSLYDGPVDETTPFPMVFYVRPKPGSMNGDTVHITANYNNNQYTSFATDTVSVVLQGTFLPTLDVDVDSDNDNLGAQYRPPSHSQAEDDVEEFPGMTMTAGEDWAKIVINGSFAWPGTLMIYADNDSGFEFADATLTPIPPGYALYDGTGDGLTAFPLIFYVRPTASATEFEETNITADFYEDESGNYAMDVVKVVYQPPPPPPPVADIDVDSDNDNQATQFRLPSHSQAEDNVEEAPGMIMNPGEDWAKIEINISNLPASGTLDVTVSGQPESFDFVDSNFSPTLDPYMLFSGPVDESITLPMVFYVRPKPGTMSGESVIIVVSYDGGPPIPVSTDKVKITCRQPQPPTEFHLVIHHGGMDLDVGEEQGVQGAAVPDQEAQTTGAIILVNWDDDDADVQVDDDGDFLSEPVPDMDEHPVTGEDNLAQLEIVFPSLPQSGIVRLAIGGGGVSMWDSPTKEKQVTQFEWNLSNPIDRGALQDIIDNGKLWIEATEVSPTNEADVTFVLSYDDGGAVAFAPVVKAKKVQVNLGNAVYRDNELSLPALAARGHAAMVWKYTGGPKDHSDDTKFLIFEMKGPTSDKKLTTITASTGGGVKRGCYTYSHKSFTKKDRLKVMAMRGVLAKLGGLRYPGLGEDAVKPKSWNGKISAITHLRCDALVEVCYEKAGLVVWSKYRPKVPANPVTGAPLRKAEWKSDIASQSDIIWFNPVTNGYLNSPNIFKDNLEEHNDVDGVGGWSDTLQPATQAGYVKPAAGYHTYFAKQDLVLPKGAGSTGGN